MKRTTISSRLIRVLADPRTDIDDRVEMVLWADPTTKMSKQDFVSFAYDAIYSCLVHQLTHATIDEFENASFYRFARTQMLSLYYAGIRTYNDWSYADITAIEDFTSVMSRAHDIVSERLMQTA